MSVLYPSCFVFLCEVSDTFIRVPYSPFADNGTNLLPSCNFSMRRPITTVTAKKVLVGHTYNYITLGGSYSCRILSDPIFSRKVILFEKGKIDGLKWGTGFSLPYSQIQFYCDASAAPAQLLSVKRAYCSVYRES